MEREKLTQWVKQARDGNEDAFGQIVVATWAPLVALARIVLAESHLDAEDVVQEAYCQAWRALPKLRSSAAFVTWLRKITIREARRWQRRPRWTASDGDHLQEAPNQQDGDIAKALAQLPNRQRTVLFLGEIEGLSDAEVAATLGIRPSTVRVHRQRGRERLRQLLNAEQTPEGVANV